MDTEGRPVTTDRRRHWTVEPERPRARRAAIGEPVSPAESRREAKRLLWRDSAIILVGIVLAALVVNYAPAMFPALAADQTDSPPGGGTSPSRGPDSSFPPGATFGPVVDPGLGIDGTAPPAPGVTLPPTGTSAPHEPGATDRPGPKPTKRPPATIAPETPRPTAEPTPDPTTEVTPEPTPEPTQAPTAEPPPTGQPT